MKLAYYYGSYRCLLMLFGTLGFFNLLTSLPVCILVSVLSLGVTVHDVGRNDSLLLRLIFIFLFSSLPLKKTAIYISKKVMFLPKV